jgi:hypothetical protein
MFVVIGTIWAIVSLVGLTYGLTEPYLEEKRNQKLFKDWK